MHNHQADSPLYMWPDVWSADLHLLIWSMVIHDTEYPYWDQVSLNNTNQTKPDPVRWWFGYVPRSRSFNSASVTAAGGLFSYASIIFQDFHFCASKEPSETCIIKGSRKLRNLQYFQVGSCVPYESPCYADNKMVAHMYKLKMEEPD